MWSMTAAAEDGLSSGSTHNGSPGEPALTVPRGNEVGDPSFLSRAGLGFVCLSCRGSAVSNDGDRAFAESLTAEAEFVIERENVLAHHGCHTKYDAGTW